MGDSGSKHPKDDPIYRWERINELWLAVEESREAKQMYVKEQKYEMAAAFRDIERSSLEELNEYGLLTDLDKERFHVTYFKNVDKS
jgi:hypothetical protein